MAVRTNKHNITCMFVRINTICKRSRKARGCNQTWLDKLLWDRYGFLLAEKKDLIRLSNQYFGSSSLVDLSSSQHVSCLIQSEIMGSDDWWETRDERVTGGTVNLTKLQSQLHSTERDSLCHSSHSVLNPDCHTANVYFKKKKESRHAVTFPEPQPSKH